MSRQESHCRLLLTVRRRNTANIRAMRREGQVNAYMNYIELLNAFYEFIQCSGISGNGQLLYYILMAINNRAGWSEWFARTNLSICGLMRVSEKTFMNAREELKQLGLIEFIPSKKRGDCTMYRILSPEVFCTGKFPVQTPVQTPVQIPVQSTVQTPDINKLKQKHKKSNTDVLPEKPEAFSSQLTTICELYNSICGSYPRLVKLSEARKKAVRARLNTGYAVDDFRKLFEMAEASDFLKGKNQRNWRATFDWLIQDNNMTKVLEGKYANVQQEKEQSKPKPQPNNRFHNFPERDTDYDAMVLKRLQERLGE